MNAAGRKWCEKQTEVRNKLFSSTFWNQLFSNTYRTRRAWGPERHNNFPKITQIFRDRARIGTRVLSWDVGSLTKKKNSPGYVGFQPERKELGQYTDKMLWWKEEDWVLIQFLPHFGRVNFSLETTVILYEPMGLEWRIHFFSHRILSHLVRAPSILSSYHLWQFVKFPPNKFPFNTHLKLWDWK